MLHTLQICSMCVYIYQYIYTYIYVHIDTHLSLHIYIYMYWHVDIYIYIYIYIYVCCDSLWPFFRDGVKLVFAVRRELLGESLRLSQQTVWVLKWFQEDMSYDVIRSVMLTYIHTYIYTYIYTHVHSIRYITQCTYTCICKAEVKCVHMVWASLVTSQLRT